MNGVGDGLGQSGWFNLYRCRRSFRLDHHQQIEEDAATTAVDIDPSELLLVLITTLSTLLGSRANLFCLLLVVHSIDPRHTLSVSTAHDCVDV